MEIIFSRRMEGDIIVVIADDVKTEKKKSTRPYIHRVPELRSPRREIDLIVPSSGWMKSAIPPRASYSWMSSPGRSSSPSPSSDAIMPPWSDDRSSSSAYASSVLGRCRLPLLRPFRSMSSLIMYFVWRNDRTANPAQRRMVEAQEAGIVISQCFVLVRVIYDRP